MVDCYINICKIKMQIKFFTLDLNPVHLKLTYLTPTCELFFFVFLCRLLMSRGRMYVAKQEAGKI